MFYFLKYVWPLVILFLYLYACEIFHNTFYKRKVKEVKKTTKPSGVFMNKSSALVRDRGLDFCVVPVDGEMVYRFIKVI